MPWNNLFAKIIFSLRHCKKALFPIITFQDPTTRTWIGCSFPPSCHIYVSSVSIASAYVILMSKSYFLFRCFADIFVYVTHLRLLFHLSPIHRFNHPHCMCSAVKIMKTVLMKCSLPVCKKKKIKFSSITSTYCQPDGSVVTVLLKWIFCIIRKW